MISISDLQKNKQNYCEKADLLEGFTYHRGLAIRLQLCLRIAGRQEAVCICLWFILHGLLFLLVCLFVGLRLFCFDVVLLFFLAEFIYTSRWAQGLGKIIQIKTKINANNGNYEGFFKIRRLTRPGLAIRKNSIFGHYSGSNSRSNSGPIFDLRSS